MDTKRPTEKSSNCNCTYDIIRCSSHWFLLLRYFIMSWTSRIDIRVENELLKYTIHQFLSPTPDPDLKQRALHVCIYLHNRLSQHIRPIRNIRWTSEDRPINRLVLIVYNIMMSQVSHSLFYSTVIFIIIMNYKNRHWSKIRVAELHYTHVN